MRIAFDSSPLVRPYPPGVVRACRGLMEALNELADVQLVPLAPSPGENERWWRHFLLPEQIQRAQVIGLHSPISAFPTRGPGRRVSTVHELPWRNNCKENAGVQHRFWARFGVGRADGVVCPTEFVRQQLIEESGNGLHVHACPWGVDQKIAHAPEEPPKGPRRLIEEETPFCLVIGGTRPKKNLRRCFEALASLHERARDKGLHLVVTGAETESLLEDLRVARGLGIGQLVHWVGHVSESELGALTEAAGFTCVMSHSEGFGFPVLESYVRGTPVLVSRASAQAEIAGEHAILASSHDSESIAAGMQAAMSFNLTRQPQLREHAARYSWQRCAQQVRELWGTWS